MTVIDVPFGLIREARLWIGEEHAESGLSAESYVEAGAGFPDCPSAGTFAAVEIVFQSEPLFQYALVGGRWVRDSAELACSVAVAGMDPEAVLWSLFPRSLGSVHVGLPEEEARVIASAVASAARELGKTGCMRVTNAACAPSATSPAILRAASFMLVSLVTSGRETLDATGARALVNAGLKWGFSWGRQDRLAPGSGA